MSRGGSFGSFHARLREGAGLSRQAFLSGQAGRMIGPLLIVVGALMVAAAAILLRGIGPAYRIGRTLSAAPELALADVVALAQDARGTDGGTRYVRTRGRISSEEEFPDENDRPLVYRRQRLQRRDGRAWKTLDDDRVAVPFGIEDRQVFLAVDVDVLGDGLVVVPREAVGVASDLPATMLPEGVKVPPDAAVRVRIDQLSAIEQATIAGVPTLGPSGAPTMTAGMGRPLIVTSLAPTEAMRILGSERRGTVKAAAMLLVAGPGCLAVGLVASVLAL